MSHQLTSSDGAVGAIDCDVHCTPRATEVLLPYLDSHWREYIRTSAFKGAVDSPYPRRAPTSVAEGVSVPRSGPPGSDLDLLRHDTLEPLGLAQAVLNCSYGVQSLRNPDLAAAMASAVNDWLIHDWLEEEPRLRASVVVPTLQPDSAAREIDRVGGHPSFVQVFLPVQSEAPYGNRRYWPIYEAALRHDLAISIQPGASAGQSVYPVGWPSYYIEEYAGLAQVFQTQLVSLVSEGVFDRFESLRVVLVEGGFAWLPSLMWRFDKDWKALRREIPWVRRLPSDYVREHVRFTLQPLDAPAESRWLLEIVDQMGSDELILFSSDYPHSHFASVNEAIPSVFPAQLRQRILSENARAFYRL